MIKRILDATLSGLGLVVLTPVLVVLCVLVKLYDFGPVLFVQSRVGLGGRNFKMYKFRTMIVNADQSGAPITVGGDSRITPVGRLLRATKVDELPQLWNVLKGEMSFVGPRPEVRRYVDLYTADQTRVLELIPGITDLASFAFYNESELLRASRDPELYYKTVLVPEKIRINLEYSRRANILFDFLLIVFTVLRGFGLRADLFSWFHVQPPQIRSGE